MKPVVLVCGFGRCGSSLMMQMLEAGTVPVTGKWPAFEDGRFSVGTTPSVEIMRQLEGTAVKVLDPHEVALPQGDYLAIWLDRDLKQQAKSYAKFIRLMLGLPGAKRGALAASFKRDRPRAIKALVDAGARTVVQVRFESLLANPAGESHLIAEYLHHAGISVCERGMASAVLPRSPQCEPGLEIELALSESRPDR